MGGGSLIGFGQCCAAEEFPISKDHFDKKIIIIQKIIKCLFQRLKIPIYEDFT